ncbi:methyltransferase domain-containing protein [Nocardioides sp. YIM 152315]|uniref:class I SAM-dependent methyltransferase n=1 Tax=Nocardioides sp. YIM 152315 TaxID=3031760 RepID=UPI0023DA9905|nr:methyltransferase domain-containing protein [Nocardioides sp. YIM 152315]MDF1603506.1 hypothetical protein [Nocardioides sp. YIM 152315]
MPPILDGYASEAPTPQLAIDIFAGEWSSTFPAGNGDSGGHAALFEDARIAWAIDRLGGVEGRSVLELGPLEGGHTTMLERAGATVTAVEANSRSYLKCLVTKEIMGLQRSRFLRGDFVAYLERDRPSYDVVLASGVLYHMIDPLRLLELVASVADALVLWTHYYDAAIIGAAPIARQFSRPPDTVVRDDRTYTLHRRDYLEALGWGGFSGGGATYANWLERDDILAALRTLGYDDVETGFDQPDHPNGPAFAVVARRATPHRRS